MAKKVKRRIKIMNDYLARNYTSGSILERTVYGKETQRYYKNKYSIIESKIFQPTLKEKIEGIIEKCLRRK